jgi:hypothetical protein
MAERELTVGERRTDIRHRNAVGVMPDMSATDCASSRFTRVKRSLKRCRPPERCSCR